MKQALFSKVFRIGVVGVLGVLVIVGIFSLIRMTNEITGRSSQVGMYTSPATDSVSGMSLNAPSMMKGGIERQEVYSGGALESGYDVSEEMSLASERPQKMIKSGSLNVRVENADNAVQEIRGVTEYYEGQVFSVNLRESAQGIKSGNVTIKVPVDTFDRAMAGLKEIDSVSLVLQETVSGQDVTEQYVDLEGRLLNKRAEEQAFLDLLNREDDKLSDVISVTRELSRVRGEIESIQGQLRYLDSKTDMSTITMTLSEDQTVTIIDTWRPLQELKNSINNLLSSLQGFVSLVIVFATWFLPMALVYGITFGILFWIGRGIYRRMKRKKE